MNEVQRLREEVRKRRTAVTNKIGRTRRQNGANVAGSEFDVRRAHGAEKSYNAPQLRAYLSQLNGFMQRDNQFLGGSRGTPIPRVLWRQYKHRENKFSAQAETYMAGMEGIHVSPLNDTVGGLKAMRHQSTEGSVVRGPYVKNERDVRNIASAGALKKLIADLDNKTARDYLPNEIQKGRDNLKLALTKMGDNDSINKIDKLTDFQFDVLWFGTNFAEAIFLQYEDFKDDAVVDMSPRERWQDKVVSDNAELAREVLDWAPENLPRTRPTGTEAKATGKRNKRR